MSQYLDIRTQLSLRRIWHPRLHHTILLRVDRVTVQDVHQVPGHIACDASTECEIVVPLKYSLLDASAPSGKRSIPLGVLDIDCQKAASWSSEDEEGLRKIVDWLMQEDGVVDWKGAFRSLNSAA